MNKLRSDLPPLPPRIAALPIDERGYPVPWFVQWLTPDNQPSQPGIGRPEFRMADAHKIMAAVKLGLCWVCGQPLGAIKVAVIGPMCCISRTTAEPPSHNDCAEFSVKACPFLTKPQMVRREDDFTKAHKGNTAGISIDRNPGVSALWAMKDYTRFRDHHGRVLFRVGDPLWVKWFALGKPATRQQVMESIGSGLPALTNACQGIPEELAALAKAVEAINPLLPPP